MQRGTYMNEVLFFKQKTSYELRLSLVVSEMCIRDRHRAGRPTTSAARPARTGRPAARCPRRGSWRTGRVLGRGLRFRGRLLYNSDAAGEKKGGGGGGFGGAFKSLIFMLPI